MKQLSIPATMAYLPGIYVEFDGELYKLMVDPETRTPYIQLEHEGQMIDFPFVHGDEVGFLNGYSNETDYRKLTEFDRRSNLVYEPWTKWWKSPSEAD